MIPDFVALCTVAYVVIDDLYRAHLAPLDRRPGPRGRCSDSEIIALTLVAELVGLDEEVAFLAYLRRNHPTLFPSLQGAAATTAAAAPCRRPRGPCGGCSSAGCGRPCPPTGATCA